MSIGRVIRFLIALVITAVFGWVINYFAMPAWTFESTGFWWFCIIELAILAVFCRIGDRIADDVYDAPIFMLISVGGAIAMLLVCFFTGIGGWEMTSADEYQKIAQIEDGVFEEDVLEASSDDLVVVDVRTAIKIGNRKLGEVKNSTWYEVNNEFNLITIKGEKHRISPLDYGGISKFFKAKEVGIPGYILINALDQEDSEYVILDEPMKYSPSACFEYDLTRHIHKQFPSYMLAKHFFEVDDEGKPYWITGVYDATIGNRGGLVIKSVIITDAVSGKMEEVKLEDLPEWVDHALSVNYLMRLADWHYTYVHGFGNSIFAKTDVFNTSYKYRGSNSDESDANTPFDGYNSVTTKDGSIWFYTGITPANNSESNTGFLLISPRTGEMRYYKSSGAEESSAQIGAEALISEKKYSASFPTIVNVNGEETYFMTLKDAAGLVQRYAFCSVENYTICVCADTIEKALYQYQVKMGFVEGNESIFEDDGDTGVTNKPEEDLSEREYKTAKGKVTLVEKAEIDGYTYYYFMIEGEMTIFMSSIENSNMQPIKLVENSEVKITYYDSKENGIGIVTQIYFESGM